MRMQHVVAVGDLKFPEGVVATVLSVVTSKVHLKGTGTKGFFFCLCRLLLYQHLLYVRMVKVVFQDSLETVESEPWPLILKELSHILSVRFLHDIYFWTYTAGKNYWQQAVRCRINSLSNLINSLLTKGPTPEHWLGPLHPSPLMTLDAAHAFGFCSLNKTGQADSWRYVCVHAYITWREK